MNQPQEGATPPAVSVGQSVGEFLRQPVGALAFALPLALITYFFGLHHYFEEAHGATVIKWLTQTWNKANELEHAWMVPPIVAYLLFNQRRSLLDGPVEPSARLGLFLLAVAAFFFLASVRTLQPRLAVGSLPIFVLAVVTFHVGVRTAKSIAVPLGLIYFTVPVPGLTQATNGLQLVATNIAFQISKLCGVAVTRSGNELASPTDAWGFDVAEGCSGLRSLLALTLVAAVYAYMTQKNPLKGLLVFASSVPLAIIANAIRVATIIILAEYVSPKFAGGVYHDWAGFLFFLAVGLTGLLLVDKLVNLNTSKVETTQIRRQNSPED